MAQEKARYSFSWANSVVKELRESRPRATEVVLDMLGMTYRDLATLLANGDPMFAQIKVFIKKLEKLSKGPGYTHTAVKHISTLVVDLRRKLIDKYHFGG